MSDQSTQPSADDRHLLQSQVDSWSVGWILLDLLGGFLGGGLVLAGALGLIRSFVGVEPEKLNGVDMAAGMSMALLGLGFLLFYAVCIRIQLSRPR